MERCIPKKHNQIIRQFTAARKYAMLYPTEKANAGKLQPAAKYQSQKGNLYADSSRLPPALLLLRGFSHPHGGNDFAGNFTGP